MLLFQYNSSFISSSYVDFGLLFSYFNLLIYSLTFKIIFNNNYNTILLNIINLFTIIVKIIKLINKYISLKVINLKVSK